MPRDFNKRSVLGVSGNGFGAKKRGVKSERGFGRPVEDGPQPQNQIPMDQEPADTDGRIPSERTREIEERLDVLDEKTKNVDLLKGRLSSLEALLTGGNPFSRQNMPILEEGRGIRLEKTVGRVKISTLGDQAGSGQSLDGYEIYLAVGTRFHVTNTQAMTDYDPETDNDWSLEFDVTTSSLDDYAETSGVMSNPLGVSTVNEPVAGTELLHDANAGADPVVAQSYYRLPIIRDGKRISFGGAYRENIMCAGSKGPVVELVRIG
jgi:hypothetical protein